MLEIFKAGGWLMPLIGICSVISMAIVSERLWSLQTKLVAPENLLSHVVQWAADDVLDKKRVEQLKSQSHLGKVLAAALSNRDQDRDAMKDSIEEVGRHVNHELGRYLNALGTIASIAPLLGLLGTVVGMIKVFTAINAVGTGDASVLAGGISEALITTAAGLSVAIPALMFYRYFVARVEELVVLMEQEALKLVEVLHSNHMPVRDHIETGGNEG